MSIARKFRDLHDNRVPLRLPNAWDVASARLFESLGASAIATTSAGMAWSLGYRDGRVVPAAEVIAAAARITRVATVPVSVDIENGYSDHPDTVAATVVRLAEVGVAGINIEDGRDTPDSLARKIEAVREAVVNSGGDIFINARSDVFLARLVDDSQLVAESVRRGRLYATAGADGLFLPAIRQPEHIQKVVQGMALPLNAMVVPNLAGAEELGKLGVRRLSAGAGISLAIWKQAESLAREFLQSGRSDPVTAAAMPYAQMQALFPG